MAGDSQAAEAAASSVHEAAASPPKPAKEPSRAVQAAKNMGGAASQLPGQAVKAASQLPATTYGWCR